MKNFILLICLIIVCSPIFSQRIGDKNTDLAAEVNYEVFTQLFDEPILDYDIKVFDEKEQFEDPIFSEDHINALTTKMAKNIRAETQGFGAIANAPKFINVRMSIPIPEKINEISKQPHPIKVRLKDVFTSSEVGEPIEVKLKSGGTSVHETAELQEFLFKFFVTNEIVNSLSFSGSATFEISFLIGFEKYEISKENIGDSLHFESGSIVIKDLFFNKIVLENLYPMNYSNPIDLSVLALSRDGKNIYTQKAIFVDGSEKNSMTYSYSRSGFRDATIPGSLYDLIKNNPDVSFKDFKKAYFDEKIMNEEDLNLIIQSPGPMEKAIIYKAIYSSPHEIKLDI